jgi:protein-disulfide isomerase
MSKAARQRTAREQLAEERARQERRDGRQRALLMGATALVILSIVVGVGVYLSMKKEQGALAALYTGPLAPVTRQADGSTAMARPGVTGPTLEIFEDFQCPYCDEFETTAGSTVKSLAAQGKVRVVYRPFKLFSEDPESANSGRAANAALCAPARYRLAYHDLLYKHQPAEGTTGFSDRQLIGWAGTLGFDDATFQRCVTTNAEKPRLDQMTGYAFGDRKITGTPTVFLNGTALAFPAQLLDTAALRRVVLAAGPAPTA